MQLCGNVPPNQNIKYKPREDHSVYFSAQIIDQLAEDSVAAGQPASQPVNVGGSAHSRRIFSQHRGENKRSCLQDRRDKRPTMNHSARGAASAQGATFPHRFNLAEPNRAEPARPTRRSPPPPQSIASTLGPRLTAFLISANQ